MSTKTADVLHLGGDALRKKCRSFRRHLVGRTVLGAEDIGAGDTGAGDIGAGDIGGDTGLEIQVPRTLKAKMPKKVLTTASENFLSIKTCGKFKDEEAMTLLRKAASTVKPIMKKRGWVVKMLREFYPKQDNLLGLNVNRGAEIKIRLRPHYDENVFFDFECILGTMLHELVHILRGPHDAIFYKHLDELTAECEDNIKKGWTGDGFDSNGFRLGQGVSHNLPEHLAKKAAAEAAQTRLKKAKVMIPAGGRRLGSATGPEGDSLSSLEKKVKPGMMAAIAAERRMKDRVWCGSKENAEDANRDDSGGSDDEDTAGSSETTTNTRNPASIPNNVKDRCGLSKAHYQRRKYGTRKRMEGSSALHFAESRYQKVGAAADKFPRPQKFDIDPMKLTLSTPLSLFAIVASCCCVSAVPTPSTNAVQYHLMPSLREQVGIEMVWVDDRVNNLLPQIMEKNELELWIVSQREYAEDPVFWAMVPRTISFSARRRTLMAFYKSPDSPKLKQWRFIDNTPQVWEDFRKMLEEHDPKSIAMNIDSSFAFADGMHVGEFEAVIKHLPVKFLPRLVRKPLVAVEFLAARAETMLPYYQKLMQNVHSIIREGFSSSVITPGKTTTEDVQWWFRDKIQSMNMTTWFHPSVDLMRPGKNGKPIQKSGADAVIEKGDLLWTDFGVTFMGLNTDSQYMGYVLKDGETEAPIGLQKGLTHNSNVIQDILMKEIVPGRTGNEVLAITLAEMKKRGIEGTVYCHPIGDYGHASGSLIGMSNLQDGVPILGDIPIFNNMWYSIELQSNVPIPEWGGQIANFRQEEEMYIDKFGKTRWVDGRQSSLLLVGESKSNVVAVAGSSGNKLALQF
ncbi:hypothetical protein HDV05_005817 [Chytridiales sp. JEL 0842]|nr:hypothetical protein HDV05_005817 [Chytridiales sp. JEL 0842]